MADAYTSRSRPRRRWGRRLLITLIVLLVILGVGLVVLDRFAASFAEGEIADRVAQEMRNQKATSAQPEVSVGGVPFLTQVVAGRYHEITILLRDFSAPAEGDRTIKMPLLDIRAKDVRAPLRTVRTGQGSIVASTVTGTGTLSYPDVAALIGQPGLTLSERQGQLVGKAPVQFLGQKFNVTGVAKLAVTGDAVQVRLEGLTAEGVPAVPLVQTFIDSYAKKLNLDLRIPALPLHLKVKQVQPTPAGLVVTTGADEVPLNTGGS